MCSCRVVGSGMGGVVKLDEIPLTERGGNDEVISNSQESHI